MYCRYCGAQLPDDAKFCRKCGKKLNEENVKNEREDNTEETGKKKFSWVLPVYLLLGMFFSAEIVGALLLGIGIGRMFIAPISWLAMIIAVIVLCKKGKIRSECMDAKVLLLPVALGILEIGTIVLLAINVNLMSGWMGNIAAMVAQWLAQHLTRHERVYALQDLWNCGLLVYFLCLKSGTTRVKKIPIFILTVVMIGWSILISSFAFEFASRFGIVMEGEAYWVQGYRLYFDLMWLRRLLLLCFVVQAGCGRIGWIRMILYPILTFGACLLLLFGMVIFMKMGMGGILACTGGYLLTLPLVFIGRKKVLKEI